MPDARRKEVRLLVPRQDAACILSISLRTLDYLIARGELPARRLGRRVLIPRRALEEFAQTMSVKKTMP